MGNFIVKGGVRNETDISQNSRNKEKKKRKIAQTGGWKRGDGGGRGMLALKGWLNVAHSYAVETSETSSGGGRIITTYVGEKHRNSVIEGGETRRDQVEYPRPLRIKEWLTVPSGN